MSEYDKEVKEIIKTGFNDINENIEIPERLKNRMELKEKYSNYEEKKLIKKSCYIPRLLYVCLLVVVLCISGFGIYKFADNINILNNRYKYKNVEMLELSNDDYCLAYSKYLEKKDIKFINNDYIEAKNYNCNYLINKNSKNYLVIIDKNMPKYYELNLSLSFDEIIEKYNQEYNNLLDITRLNENNYGLLFNIEKNGIIFYMYDENHEKKVIFVNF